MAKTNWNTMGAVSRRQLEQFTLFVLKLADEKDSLSKSTRAYTQAIATNKERLMKCTDPAQMVKIRDEIVDFQKKVDDLRATSEVIQKGYDESIHNAHKLVTDVLYKAYCDRKNNMGNYRAEMRSWVKATFGVSITDETLNILVTCMGDTNSRGGRAKTEKLGLGTLKHDPYAEILIKNICILDKCINVSTIASENGITLNDSKKKSGKK